MSQYLSFYLKHKKSDTKLCVGYFCTTPARQIANTGAFPYTENEQKLTEEYIKIYISNIESEINVTKKFKKEACEHKLELLDIVYKCNSKEVVESLYDKIQDNDIAIRDYIEEIEDWNYRLNKITLISEIYNDNKDNWDLYYINC